MAAFKWVRVSKNSPCPVCKSPDWCSISTDGAVAKCMRVEEGCFRRREDRNGACYFLHRLTDNPPPGGPPPPPSAPATKRADADTLHAVYSALLDCLALSDAHREALRRRRLTDEIIERNRYRTLPVQGRTRIVRQLRERFGDRLLRVPGFIVKEGKSGRYITIRGPAGLLVPCRDLAGNVVALKVRRDDPTEGGPRYVYLSSTGHGGPGPGSPAHVPLGTQATAELARVTEGELKADVVQALTALPTLSAPGVSNWRICLDVLKALGCKTVRLAFDADAPEKPAVARALSACAEALDSAGYAVELESWDAADGKGLDDLLTASKAPQLLQGDAVRQALREIVAAASALEEVAPPSELDRLQDVLDAGGAEALFRDRALLQALANLAVSDSAAFLALRASIRGRVSVRDLDRALQPFRRQSSTPSAGEGPVYFEQHGCIYRNLQTKDGPVPVPLCNFAARIVEDVVHDDGAEQTRHLAIEGTLADGSPLYRTEIPAADFPGMGWTVPAWGTRPVVYAGMGMKDHLRAALQLLSGEVPRRTIFGHIGWRKVGETWLYLHAGGAIGASGLVEEVPVLLPDPLANFRLPPPPPARL
ncbi:MAG TPA: DUF3854 domain-containing protein, partial [Gemmataceae bacterium]|nr:DUF3854 domain-containing protein [Gemmataceae bacterium]